MTTPQPPEPPQHPTPPPGPDAADDSPFRPGPTPTGSTFSAGPAPTGEFPVTPPPIVGDPFQVGPAGEPQVESSNRPARPWLIAAGAGAVIGALVVGILWAASSFVGANSGSEAAEDAAAACGVFERVPDDWKQETITEENTYQLGGAIALAQAAGKRDAEYRVLATQAQQVQQAVVSFDITRVNQLVVDVRNTCDEL
ncbi:hypothetical protein M1L60_06075 [Actinoplanes sp. TRM 88003]|uniref:Uncharacterized protein n=1 Tax=Paractinoplanes aksuensis TaxID=2939490 RepID=A0ABT1DH40_9ACTN|nr:hypothetical protein [Actinoplanes aksuensis]MCO8270158.1 hypothetical protein [Actinoplanes aksuensis]